MLTRRSLLLASPLLLWRPAAAAPPTDEDIGARLEAIRKRTGGRLGVYALDTGSGRSIALDEHSRYAMASTFKVLLAAAILQQVDARTLSLDQVVKFGPQDMVSYSPVTSEHLAKGSMTITELCAAVIELSDNPAANLLLGLIDGPAGLTRFVRRLGDELTRLDRRETGLNTNIPGDERDTTTPHAMVHVLQKILTQNVLSSASHDRLIGWLVGSRTGLQRIRAGLPQDWKVGDKTGSGMNGAINDVAIAWPPGRAPLLLAIYMSGSTLPTAQLNEAHAEIARLVAWWVPWWVPGSSY
jgi:beta-lactamase class A